MVRYKNNYSTKVIAVVNGKLICLEPAQEIETNSIVHHPALVEVKPKPIYKKKVVKHGNSDKARD